MKTNTIFFIALLFLCSCSLITKPEVEVPEIPEKAPILLTKDAFTGIRISFDRRDILSSKWFGRGYLDCDITFRLPGSEEIFGLQISGKHPKLFRRINTSYARITNLKWYVKKRRIGIKKELPRLRKNRFVFREEGRWYLAEAGIYVFQIGKRTYTLITNYTAKKTWLFRVRLQPPQYLFEFPFAGHNFYINYKTREIGEIEEYSS